MQAPAETAEERCFSCGGRFVVADGAIHAYMLSSPGCWAAYGVLLAREYESPMLFGAAHRMTVDAYALEHPGDRDDRRSVQSVWVHYAALHLLFAGKTVAAIPPLMQRLAGRDFPPLPPSPAHFTLTHADVLAAPASDHVSAVRAWAMSAYAAWSSLCAPTENLLSHL